MRKPKKEVFSMNKVLNVITNVLAYITKNVGLFTAVVESAIKVLAGIATLTPTEKDDKLVEWLKSHSLAEKIQKVADILKKFKGFIG